MNHMNNITNITNMNTMDSNWVLTSLMTWMYGLQSEEQRTVIVPDPPLLINETTMDIYNHNHKYHNNYTEYEYLSNTETMFINMAFVFIILLSCSLSCYKSRNDYRNIQNNENNENLLQNESNSENNQNHQNNQNQTIEKIELTFTNNLNNKNCSICLDEFNENEILFQLICNHYYHKKCINDWLRKNRSCPLCRTDLV